MAHRSILDIRVHCMLDAQKTRLNSHHGLKIRVLPLTVNQLAIITGDKGVITDSLNRIVFRARLGVRYFELRLTEIRLGNPT